MIRLRPRQGNLRLVSRLFSLMRGKPCIRLNNLKTSLRFPCRGLNPIIDSISLAVDSYRQHKNKPTRPSSKLSYCPGGVIKTEELLYRLAENTQLNKA